MTSATDHFSSKSREYSYSRPFYPEDLFEFLQEITPNKYIAWDCATGNGQAAIGLCRYFRNVIASDVSKNQIANGFPRNNITYEIFSAEKPSIQDNSVDLITVAEAIHWFDFEKFYREATRVSRRNAIIAVWSYGMHKIDSEIDKISERLDVDGEILGSYWPKEAKYVKEEYKTIPFPFKELSTPRFEMSVYWSLDDVISYMQTWSAVKRFKIEKKYDPMSLVWQDLKKLWRNKDEKKLIKWSLNLRAGIIQN